MNLYQYNIDYKQISKFRVFCRPLSGSYSGISTFRTTIVEGVPKLSAKKIDNI